MKLKIGVKLAGLQLPMRKVLIEADALWKIYGRELIITSGLDKVHSPGSLHPYGYALDLRICYFARKYHKDLAKYLQQRLGDRYEVILRKTYMHVEYDSIIKEGR